MLSDGKLEICGRCDSMVKIRGYSVEVQVSHGDQRTGDWGYMLSDGKLEICGRCDSMVKIRGYSVEVQVSHGD